MTRDEIEEMRHVLKTYFPNKSEDRAIFNRICDQAVIAARPEARLIEVGEMVEIPDGFDVQPNTIYCMWNDKRSRLAAGTKVYIMGPGDAPAVNVTPMNVGGK